MDTSFAAIVQVDEQTAAYLYRNQATSINQHAIGYQSVLPVVAATQASLHHQHADWIEPPWWVAHESEQDNFKAVMWIDPQLTFFAGHFPGAPILPGVVQVNWAINVCRTLLPSQAQFIGIQKLKFIAPTYPASWLSLELQRHQNRVEFVFRDAARVRTQGRLQFHE